MNDALESVRQKVVSIFRELVGIRAHRLDSAEVSHDAQEAAATALATDFDKRASDIAFHMTDWNWDAAFVVALHLFPEKFTSEEIDAGIRLFLCHAPNHIREACRLTNTYVWEVFPDVDQVVPEFELCLPSIGVTSFPGKGRGVVAQRHFEPGETVEQMPVIVVPQAEVSLIRQTRLANYYFEWGEDCKQGAIALGYGSLYNHSYTPNARYEFREENESLEFIALCEIRPGEEITINYNNLGPSAKQPLKFDVKE
jgi:uncharacterized protein